MPTGPADDKGTYLYYEDSGVPGESTDYATLFLVHGTMFHSAVFRPMIPFAIKQNLRLVLVNARDYPGSSPYTQEERQLLIGPAREDQALAIRTRGMEIAYFMAWFAMQEHLPPIQVLESGVRKGGFALLGWSSGNCQTVPVVAHADKLPKETRELFSSYFRTYFFHDSSLTGIGEGAPPDWYSIFRDGDLSYEERVKLFPLVVSTYHAQTDLEPESPAFIAKLKARLDALEGEEWKPSILRLGPENFVQVADPGVMSRSQVLIQRVDTAIYQENLRRALGRMYVDDGDGQQEVWPALQVKVLWCDMSVSEELLAASRIMAVSRSLQPNARPFESVRVEKGNHLVHWDNPEMFTKLLASKV